MPGRWTGDNRQRSDTRARDLGKPHAVSEHGPLPSASVLSLAAGLAEGLGAIHAVGLVHRDLKPSNVLLADDGPRVIDFGMSRAAEASVLTRTGLVVGSPGFMSPEQAEGGEVGPASDVFSLGAVLVFAATGMPPFGTGSTAALIYRVVHSPPSLDDVPPEVLPLAERCLAKDPGQRPAPTDLLAELGDADLDPTWLPVRVLEGFAPHAPPDPASTDSPPRYVPTDRVIQASSREPAPGAPRTAAGADGPSSPADVLTVGQRVRPGPGLGNDGALSARRPRRRLLAIALACAIFTAAGLVPFVLPSTPGSPSSPGSPGHRHVAIGSLAATNCGGQGCAIAYSSVQQRPYFGSAQTGSNNGDGQIDVGVIAQAAALTKCYNSGATDCDVAVWAINGYVSIAIDSAAASPALWGVGWGGAASTAENSALNSCVAKGGSAQACQLTTEYSSPNPSLASSGYPAWGTFSDNKYAGAIVWAYQRLGQHIDANLWLVFVQKAFGWTKGGIWASPPASTAQGGYQYLKSKGLIKTALPTNPPDVGDLVWFGPAPGGQGHVGIYIGGANQFISATSGGVAIYDIPYWNVHFATYEGFSSAPAVWLR